MFEFLKSKITNWCLDSSSKTMESIYDSSNAEAVNIPDLEGSDKFIGLGKTDLLIQTPSGYSEVKNVLKTIKYIPYTVTLENGMNLIGADNHIVMDQDHNEVFIKDLNKDRRIKTINGISFVSSVDIGETPVHMYDLELDDEDHVFYTNGILSHNTTVVAMYILWFTLFNRDKECIIASKAMSHATEIMGRIKFAYEELPNWLKAGCKFYNRTSIEFDNKSKIKCEATSAKTGRGSSPAILMIDEIAFISHRIQEEMWASITPSLSTGGKFILTSTPNGDIDLFANIWRGAMSGTNSFVPLQVLWHQHPDRGPEYYQEMLGKLGPLKTSQELDCVGGETAINTSIGKITIEELYVRLSKTNKI